jgi:hypothetical protein
VADTWTGTAWFVESDIADCFGSFDHEVMLSALAEKVHDGRFLRLVRNMLQAGYLEDWTWNATLSGVPQGGVASPVLGNVYLHKLDIFMEKVLIPEYTRGGLRSRNPDYRRTEHAIERARRRGDRAQVRALYRQLHALPSQDPRDPATAGCATAATPMTPSSGSPGRRPRPRRSSAAWASSCVTNSGSDCPRRKR